MRSLLCAKQQSKQPPINLAGNERRRFPRKEQLSAGRRDEMTKCRSSQPPTAFKPHSSHAPSAARVFWPKIMALSGERHTIHIPCAVNGTRTLVTCRWSTRRAPIRRADAAPPIAPIFIDAFTSTLTVLEKYTHTWRGLQ
jgi:hypothetical protein